MDFSYLLTLAESNTSVAREELKVKRYSTDVSAAKKAPKNGVNSSAIQHFLKKKENEEKKKAQNDIKRKEELLQLRSAAKHNRKASAMAKRTKDNNFAARFDEPPPEKSNDEKFDEEDGTETAVIESQQIKKSRKREPKEDKGRVMGKSSFDTNQKTRCVSNGYSSVVDSSRDRDSSRDKDSQNKVPNKQKPRPPPQPSSNLSYHDLLKLAKTKQHEPVVIQKVDKREERLMTQEEKLRSKEEETRKRCQSSSPSASGISGKAIEKKKAPVSSILRDELTRNNENSSGKQVHSSNYKDQNKLNNSKTSSQNRNIPQNQPSQTAYSDSKLTKKPVLTKQSMKPQDSKIRTSGNPLHSKSASINTSLSKLNISKHPNPKEMKTPKRDVKIVEEKSRVKVPSSHQVPLNAIRKDVAQKSTASKQVSPKQLTCKEGSLKRSSINDSSKQNLVKGLKPGPSGESTSKQFTSRDGPPRQPSGSGGPPRQPSGRGGPQQLSGRGGPPQLSGRGGPPQQLSGRGGPPQQLSNRGGPPRQFPPRDGPPRQFPPRDGPPRQFPPRDGPPRQFPPRDMMRRPKMPVKRRIESDDEYDEEMEDFIDDSPLPEEEDYSSAIREIFNYDRRKFLYDDDDEVDDMETNFAQQMKEEAFSAKMGRLEDLEDMRLEQEELKRKKTKKRRL